MTGTDKASEQTEGWIAPPSRRVMVVPCRHCERPNRLVQMRVGDPLRLPRCGACQAPLFVGDAPLQGLYGGLYQHPWDKEALQALQAIPGIQSLLRTLLSESFERASRLYHFTSFLHCGERQVAQVYEIFREAAKRLGIDPVPDLFVSHQDTVEAYTSGVKQPFVVISAAMIEELREDELMVVLAHELGHCQNDHVLYKMAVRLFSRVASSIVTSTFGLGSLAVVPLRLALLKWDRCSDLSADRAALLAARDPDVVIRAMMKLSGGSDELESQLSRDAFLAQVEKLKHMEQEHMLNRFFSLWQDLFHTHPMPVWRTAELITWAEEGNYLPLLCGHMAPASEVAGVDARGDDTTKPKSEGTNQHKESTRQDEPLLDQMRDMGQGVVQDVQGALQQGSSLLRQWFAGSDRDNKDKK